MAKAKKTRKKSEPPKTQTPVLTFLFTYENLRRLLDQTPPPASILITSYLEVQGPDTPPGSKYAVLKVKAKGLPRRSTGSTTTDLEVDGCPVPPCVDDTKDKNCLGEFIHLL
jgi:hypothetical protein